MPGVKPNKRWKTRTKKKLKNQKWFEDFGTAAEAPCHWCKKLMTYKEATVDHEPPLSQGGTLDKFVLACYTCNNTRGTELQKALNGGLN